MRLKSSFIAFIVLFSAMCHASDESQIKNLQDQIDQLKIRYETVQTTQQNSNAASANAFNPSIALILNGQYGSFTRSPDEYKIQGFIPSDGEIGPGRRSFNLGESELTLSANIDPSFAGQLTFSITPEQTADVEEAFFQTIQATDGFNFRAGRFLSSIGYLNSQHAHAWDFVDAPLVYQAFFAGQYKPDGLQAKWLAPSDFFFEVAAEAGNGHQFPGNDRNKNGTGAGSLALHAGDDIGISASWKAGLSYLSSAAKNRVYSDLDSTGLSVNNAFSGDSKTLIADFIYKWSPNGNGMRTNLKIQGEYFSRKENGRLTYNVDSNSLGVINSHYESKQTGWYLQSVYQFMPLWRVGLRYDKLDSGSQTIAAINDGVLTRADFARLEAFKPSRKTLMLDYSPSEFSRFRLQFVNDQSQPGEADREILLQYIMSLGVHGAHLF